MQVTSVFVVGEVVNREKMLFLVDLNVVLLGKQYVQKYQRSFNYNADENALVR